MADVDDRTAYWYDLVERAIKAAEGREPAEHTSWHREAMPMVFCTCGYSLAMHRVDLVKAGMGDRTCKAFTPAEVRWKEVRWAHVRLDD